MKLFRNLLIVASTVVLANANSVSDIKLNVAPAVVSDILSKKFSDIKYIYSEARKDLISVYFNTNRSYNFSSFIPFRDSEFTQIRVRGDAFYLVKR